MSDEDDTPVGPQCPGCGEHLCGTTQPELCLQCVVKATHQNMN